MDGNGLGDELWPRIRLPDDLAGQLAGIRPLLRATEDEAERDRRLPAAAVDALHSLDLFGLAAPRSLGGWEAHPAMEMEVYEAVAHASGAAGWNLFVGSVHTGIPSAYLGDDAVDALFGGGGRAPVIAGQMQPVGTATAVEGGMRLRGRFSWGSGISHAEWVLAGAFLDPGTLSPPNFRVFVVPKEAVDVLDNWHVVGVSGSGSYDYAIDDVFVPEGWWFDAPTPQPKRGGSRYRAPMLAQIGAAHAGYASGLGRRALEELSSVALTKRRTGARGPLAESEVVQRQLGRDHTRLTAARERAMAALGDLASAAEADEGDWDLVTAQIRAAGTYITEVALDVANGAMRLAGGSVIRLDHPLQRVVRELLVAQAHVYVTDTHYAGLGRQILDRAKADEPTGGFAAPPPPPS